MGQSSLHILTNTMRKFSKLLFLFSVVFVKFGESVVEKDDSDEYDDIRPNITEEELIKTFEEMYYVLPDDDSREGIKDLIGMITNSEAAKEEGDNILNYDYKIVGGEVAFEDLVDTEMNKDDVNTNIGYLYYDTEEENHFTKEEDLIVKKADDTDQLDVVWIPIVVQYDYEMMIDTQDLFDIVEDDDTELDYQQDKNYKMFVQKAIDTSVQFESIYQEQRIFNIILLSGVSLICLIVLFGLVTLAVSIFSRSRRSNNQDHINTKLVKTGGIVKSYAKLPLEVKNILPSNIAYRELYDV